MDSTPVITAVMDETAAAAELATGVVEELPVAEVVTATTTTATAATAATAATEPEQEEVNNASSNAHVTTRLPAPPRADPSLYHIVGLDTCARAWFNHTPISSEQLRRFVTPEVQWPWAQTHTSTYRILTKRDRTPFQLDRIKLFAAHAGEARKASASKRSEKGFHRKMYAKINQMNNQYNANGTKKPRRRKK
jgi:hypothetical protein